MELENKSVLLTGAGGFLGTHLRGVLEKKQIHFNVVSSQDYDLTEQVDVRNLFSKQKPEVLFHLAGYSGGIQTNRKKPADFFYRNLMMNTMVLHEAFKAGVEKVICVMGGCSYPHDAQSPIKEEDMWNGYPQAESRGYSVAKKMLITQSDVYRDQHGFNSIVMIPGNLYGPYDNFNLNDSHVIPALIRKVYEAKERNEKTFEVWGTGKPTRDFIYAQDCAEALVMAAESYDSSEIINISSGNATSIRDLVQNIINLTKFEGELVWDSDKPDGQMYKGFDVNRMHDRLGYHAPTSLEDGLRSTIDWFSANYPNDVRL